LYVSNNMVVCQRCHERHPDHPESKALAAFREQQKNAPPPPPPVIVMHEFNGTWSERLVALERVVKAQGEEIAELRRLLGGQEKLVGKKR
jgi:hypothetical protein